MKLFGQTITEPNTDFIVIPRRDFDIVLTVRAILDDQPFLDMCPRPKPPKISRPGHGYQEEVNDKGFLRAVEKWAELKTSWIVLESLKATPKEMLEWEKVKYNEPMTWNLWKDEMKTAFFTENEIVSVINLVWSVNGVNQTKLDEARLRFLAGQQRVFNPPISQMEEQQTTRSGELVNDSVYTPLG